MPHRVHIESDDPYYASAWRAVCSCGRRSAWMIARRIVEQIATYHQYCPPSDDVLSAEE